MTSNFTAAELRAMVPRVSVASFAEIAVIQAVLREYAALKEARAAELSAQESKPEPPPAWNMLGWANYDEGGFPHFCDIEDEGTFRVYAVNPAPRDSKPELCSDCPPLDYPTDKTRCDSCPRRSKPVDVAALAKLAAKWRKHGDDVGQFRVYEHGDTVFKRCAKELLAALIAAPSVSAQDASPKDGEPLAYTYCSCCNERIPAPAKWLLGYQLCDSCCAAWKVSGSGGCITVTACHENPKLWNRPPK